MSVLSKERLTERDEFGNADIVGVDSVSLQENLLYEEMNKVTDALNKLAEYEDLEEQGLLIRTMARVGDKAYHVIVDRCHNPMVYISEHKITDVSARAVYFADCWWTRQEMENCDAFLSKSEAEEKLRELEVE